MKARLTTSNHFDRRLRECSLATLRWIVVSTGGATDPQKLSMNSLKTIAVLPRLLQRTRGRVSRKSPAYHVDDRAGGLECGAFMHGALLDYAYKARATPRGAWGSAHFAPSLVVGRQRARIARNPSFVSSQHIICAHRSLVCACHSTPRRYR
jgi:hypothetical protein